MRSRRAAGLHANTTTSQHHLHHPRLLLAKSMHTRRHHRRELFHAWIDRIRVDGGDGRRESGQRSLRTTTTERVVEHLETERVDLRQHRLVARRVDCSKYRRVPLSHLGGVRRQFFDEGHRRPGRPGEHGEGITDRARRQFLSLHGHTHGLVPSVCQQQVERTEAFLCRLRWEPEAERGNQSENDLLLRTRVAFRVKNLRPLLLSEVVHKRQVILLRSSRPPRSTLAGQH